MRTWPLFLILFVLAVIALWLMSRSDNRGDRGDPAVRRRSEVAVEVGSA